MMSEVKNHKYNDKLLIWIMKIFVFWRLLSGVYKKFFESKFVCILIKIYCICIFLTIISIYYLSFDPNTSSSLFEVVEYGFLVIYYLCFSNNSSEFLDVININDRIMGFKEASLSSKYVNYFIIINSFLRCAIGVLRYMYSFDSWNQFFCCAIAIAVVDTTLWGTIIVLVTLYERMKTLRKSIQSNKVLVNIVGRDEVTVSVRNVKKSLHYYDKLLDSIELIDNQIQFQLILQWLINILELIIVAYCAVIGVFSKARTSYIVIVFIEIIQTYAILFCPAIITAMAIYEYGQIKKILTSQLIKTPDESLRFELQTALQYLNLRPFRYTLCRAVPLDINLLFTTASICVTYVIVLLQLILSLSSS